uniref:Uncharacterized protein n=1 Tax=Oryza nivara TaxID=4536 RepID=A0A0E0FG45_ORYNI
MKRPQIALPEGVVIVAPVDLILHAETGGGAKLSRGRAPPKLGGDGAPTAAADTALACLSRLAPLTPAPWSSAGLPPSPPNFGGACPPAQLRTAARLSPVAYPLKKRKEKKREEIGDDVDSMTCGGRCGWGMIL